MLHRTSGLAGSVATLLATGLRAQEERPEPDRKLRVVAVGGHSDDPQTCAGGTLALFADQGHDVVALTLTGGPPPPPDADPEDRWVKNRLNCARAAEILRIRLECLSYSGGNMGQFRYGTACEISGERYNDFTGILLDKIDSPLDRQKRRATMQDNARQLLPRGWRIA
jgi:LmbE family N-acetylglucosaminyl deacetylase